MNTIMARNKKTRTLWQSIIHYTVWVFLIAASAIIILLMWSFGNLFDNSIWKFSMGVLGGALVAWSLTKKSDKQ